jgi:hypothetical protein
VKQPVYQKSIKKTFEMKIPRQTFKLVQAKCLWRIRCNEEITNCMMMRHFNLFTPEEAAVGWPWSKGG